MDHVQNVRCGEADSCRNAFRVPHDEREEKGYLGCKFRKSPNDDSEGQNEAWSC